MISDGYEQWSGVAGTLSSHQCPVTQASQLTLKPSVKHKPESRQ